MDNKILLSGKYIFNFMKVLLWETTLLGLDETGYHALKFNCVKKFNAWNQRQNNISAINKIN